MSKHHDRATITEVTTLTVERDYSYGDGRISIYPQSATPDLPALAIEDVHDRVRAALIPVSHRVITRDELDHVYGLPCIRITMRPGTRGLVDDLTSMLLSRLMPTHAAEPRFANARIGAPDVAKKGTYGKEREVMP